MKPISAKKTHSLSLSLPQFVYREAFGDLMIMYDKESTPKEKLVTSSATIFCFDRLNITNLWNEKLLRQNPSIITHSNCDFDKSSQKFQNYINSIKKVC